MSLPNLDELQRTTVIAHPPAVTVNLDVEQRSSRATRRRRRFLRFVALKTFALLLLIAATIAGTSQTLAEESLTLPFHMLFWISTAAVGILPVMFYGLARHVKGSRR